MLTQPRVVHRPPAYYTCDWVAAARSVVELASLRPEAAAAGHGLPMYGDELRRELVELARDFERVAVPPRGRYVSHPAVTDYQGIVALPPSDLLPNVLIGLTVAACFGAALTWASHREV